MRDDEINEDLEDFASDDLTSALERLDAGFEDFVVPDEPSSPLSRKEIDDLVEQVIAEELARLNGAKSTR
jgi:hypothetical protein